MAHSSLHDPIAAIILAAGTSSRYRAADPTAATKLVAAFDGIPLVRRVLTAALSSRASPVLVVTGHAEAQVRGVLAGLDVRFVHNPDFAAGLSTSLRAGLVALPPEAAGALILLGDMPGVTGTLLDRLIASFEDHGQDIDAVVPVHDGQRGNPALLGRVLFTSAANLGGDEGARRLLSRARVLELPVYDDAVTIDIDDPEALRRLRAGPA